MFEACAGSVVPGAPPQVRMRVAAVLQVLYAAPSWELLRNFWEMDAAEAADTIELGIRGLLDGLRAQAAGQAGGSTSPPG